MAYVTAEQTEEPAKGEHQFVPTELPQFKKNDHPISKLEGELVFAQDEQSRIAPLGFSDQQAATVLSAEVETCRNEHKGHVLRQQINVERCSIVEYSYRHSGMTHTIFINPKHSLVEDIAGPIQTAIEHMDALAKKAFDEKRYEEAYRLNLRSLCMDEATNEEKQLRDQILKRLTSSYRNTALMTWLLASLSWMFLCSPAPGQDVSNIGGFLGLLPLLGAVFLFARDPALRFRQRGSRLVCAVLLGFSAFLSGATISLNSLCGLNDRPWDDWLPFGGVILLLVVIALARAKERSRRLKIETHLKEFSTPQALEAYVCGLDPKDRTEFRAILGMSVVLLCLLATVVVAKLTTEKAAAEAKALAEKEAADAKALAENAAAEAKALAKASAEKRLEWTGKAMQRAGFKEETLKRALTQGGTLVAWGSDSFGITKVPAGLSGVVAMAAGTKHTVALKQDGTVVAWGSDSFGQTTVPAGLSGVVAMAAGTYHTVALKQDGTVVAWGSDSFGQTTVPEGLSGVVAIAAGGLHTVALKQDGTVAAWGRNDDGQTTMPAGLSGVVAIAAGHDHTVALKQDGTVVAWGNNGSGQTTVPAGLSGVVAIAAGVFHTVALKQDGTVVAWGGNYRGQTKVPAGLSGVVAIAAGDDHTVALKQDGTVVAWGGNHSGQTTVPAGLSGVVAIAGGQDHTVALKLPE